MVRQEGGREGRREGEWERRREEGSDAGWDSGSRCGNGALQGLEVSPSEKQDGGRKQRQRNAEPRLQTEPSRNSRTVPC